MNILDRRDFLRLVSAGAAATALTPRVLRGEAPQAGTKKNVIDALAA